MRNIRLGALLAGLLTAVPAFGLAQTSPASSRPAKVTGSGASPNGAGQPNGAKTATTVVHATKGVVRFVDADKLVIARSPQHGREMTFVLNSWTEYFGDLQVGSTVDVRYRTEARQRIATAVTVDSHSWVH